MGYPVVHFEITSTMAEKLHAFYKKVFGWSINADNPMNYGIVDTNAGAGINGGIGPSMGPQSTVTFYVIVPNLEDTVAKAQTFGSQVLLPPSEVMPDLKIAIITDPEGNALGLILDMGEESPGPTKGKGAAVDWFEVAGKDAKALQTFYSELFGWKLDVDNEWNYGQYNADKGISGGVGPTQGEPYLTFYIATPDLKKTLAAIEKAGGKTVMEPMKVGEDTEIAQFNDPEGNMIGLFKHEH